MLMLLHARRHLIVLQRAYSVRANAAQRRRVRDKRRCAVLRRAHYARVHMPRSALPRRASMRESFAMPPLPPLLRRFTVFQ